jgi:uncharacterized phage-associated protein
MTNTTPVPAIEVANFFIKSGNGSYSPLKLQKLVYIANLLHVAEFKKNLVKEPFQAWDYGPVIPSLYHKLKEYGRSSIARPLHVKEENHLTDQQIDLLQKVDEAFGRLPPSVLVSITHLKGGAWDKSYVAGASVDISDELIVAEADQITRKNRA